MSFQKILAIFFRKFERFLPQKRAFPRMEPVSGRAKWGTPTGEPPRARNIVLRASNQLFTMQ